MVGIRTKQWWVEKLNDILVESKLEAKINPCENENCVIVVLKEAYKEHEKKKDHHFAVKPYVKKDGFSAWMKSDEFKNFGLANILPSPRIHNKMALFKDLTDEEAVFDAVKIIANHSFFV